MAGQAGRATGSAHVARGVRAPAVVSAPVSDDILCAHAAPTSISPRAGIYRTYIDLNHLRSPSPGNRCRRSRPSTFGMHSKVSR